MKPTLRAHLTRRTAHAPIARLLLAATATAAATAAAIAAPATAGARTPHARGFFADPSAYRVVAISYSSSAVRRDHDPDTGALEFIDSQSTSAKARPGARASVNSSLNVVAVDAPITGATTGTMTRYSQGAMVGTCTYTLALDHTADALRIVLTRHHGSVGVTLIVVNNEGAYCSSTGGDAEALNWYLPDATLPLSAFAGNTVVLHSAGTHVDYPNDPSNNTYNWSLTVRLRRR